MSDPAPVLVRAPSLRAAYRRTRALMITALGPAAGRLLQDCLNDHRSEKLSPEQVMLVMRMARERECHAVMLYLARECGYSDPSPLDPETEVAKSNREVVEALARATAAMERHERLFGKPRTVEARRA